MASVDWSAVAQCVSAAAVVGALYLHWRQLRAMRMGTQAQGTLEIIGRLQADPMREARGRLFAAHCSPEPIGETTSDAETVAQVFDVMGILMRGGMIPKDLLLRPWGPAICKSWHSTSNLVHARRRRDKNPNLWESFEWLYHEARALVGDHYPEP